MPSVVSLGLFTPASIRGLARQNQKGTTRLACRDTTRGHCSDDGTRCRLSDSLAQGIEARYYTVPQPGVAIFGMPTSLVLGPYSALNTTNERRPTNESTRCRYKTLVTMMPWTWETRPARACPHWQSSVPHIRPILDPQAEAEIDQRGPDTPCTRGTCRSR